MKKINFKVIKHLSKKMQVFVLIVSLVCAGIFISTISNIVSAKTKTTTTQDKGYVRTLFLQKSSLEETVSATGNIESQDTSNVTSNVEAPIQKVLVQVGDLVEEGDIICILDSSDLQKKIEKAKETQANNKETHQLNYDNALSAKDIAWNNFNTQKTTTDTAYSTYQKALSEYQIVENSITTQQSLFSTAESSLHEKGITLSQKEGACLTKGYQVDCSDALNTTEYLEYTIAKNEYDLANQDFENAKSNLEQAKSNSNYQELYNAMSSAKSSYETMKSQLEKLQEVFSSADAKVNETYNTLTTDDNSSSDLNDLLEQVDNYTCKAKSKGKVTSLNATVGNKASGTIATIQNTNSLKMTFSIDEYDIQKISTGMNARITSDAVNEELTGIVTQISPIATTGSQGSSSGFQVEVEITSSNSSLLIGMSAKVEILISSTEDIFTVPLDAIEEKEDGTSVIYVKNEKGEFIETEVTIGNRTDYSAEISGETIKAGLEVRASAIESEAIVNDKELHSFTESGGPAMKSEIHFSESTGNTTTLVPGVQQ